MSEANKAFLQEHGLAGRTDKVILYGGNSTGKSAAVATTLIDAPEDRRVIYLMVEKNAGPGLEFGLKKYRITPKEGQLIYAYPKPDVKALDNFSRSLKAFKKESKKDALKGHSETTEGKEHYTYLDKVTESLMNFVGIDYVTNQQVKVGNIGTLTDNDILVLDGLSPIAAEIWNSSLGDKLAVSGNDYGTPQRMLHNLMSAIVGMPGHLILLAHEKEKTNDSGTVEQIQVNTMTGVANYMTFCGMFTDVIRATREGINYRWQINAPKVHASSRRIDNSERNIEPNFNKYGFFEG